VLVARRLAKNTSDGLIISNAGILLFAQDPDKYVTSAKVRYVRYDGIEAQSGEHYNVIKDEEFLGNIPTIIERLKEFIYASLRDYYYLDMEIGKFIKISEYPEDAWLEGVVNAVCHRSYNVQGNCIY
jgi:ATP-dependent DNA helicase RecG